MNILTACLDAVKIKPYKVLLIKNVEITKTVMAVTCVNYHILFRYVIQNSI